MAVCGSMAFHVISRYAIICCVFSSDIDEIGRYSERLRDNSWGPGVLGAYAGCGWDLHILN